jgi:NADPH:quinone reductase-like Zn-dependent oxidoreductase
MKVFRYNDSTTTPALLAGEAPKPTPKPGEVLVRVKAAGVTPTELLWYPTVHALDGSARHGAIPGHEFSGVIEELGEGVDPALKDTEVYGMSDWFAEGATAEYCITIPASIAPKPTNLTHAEAASVPIGALTAWQGIIDRAKLQAGERILIHGGSGAVGLYAIQIAKRIGAHITTTGSARNFDFLRGLGADELVDYRTERFEEKARDMDVVFDVMGGDTLHRSWGVLKPGGRMVTIAAASEGTNDDRIEKAFFIVEPNHAQLAEITQLLEAGKLRCFVDATVPFSKASEAYCGTIENRAGRGKIILSVVD